MSDAAVASDRQAVADRAETYYDSHEADQFYYNIWGGEDIHVGIYEAEGEAIKTASRRTVERMAAAVGGMGPGTRVLDIGAGYGGAARYLARTVGAHVTCLNISETQNGTNRRLTAEQGLADRVTVRHGSFEDVPLPDGGFDVVWSQDAILHSADRRKVLGEAFRQLRPGGHLVFTDPMQADDCPDGVLQPVYDRIHLDSLGSFAFYRRIAEEIGFEEVKLQDLSGQLRRHYIRVGEELRTRYPDIVKASSQPFVDRMLTGLENWVAAADRGYLAWGILHFRRPG